MPIALIGGPGVVKHVSPPLFVPKASSRRRRLGLANRFLDGLYPHPMVGPEQATRSVDSDVLNRVDQVLEPSTSQAGNHPRWRWPRSAVSRGQKLSHYRGQIEPPASLPSGASARRFGDVMPEELRRWAIAG